MRVSIEISFIWCNYFATTQRKKRKSQMETLEYAWI